MNIYIDVCTACAGEFAFLVGLPAKSGVSGDIMLVIPNVMGIAIYSPRLDKIGNSYESSWLSTDISRHRIVMRVIHLTVPVCVLDTVVFRCVLSSCGACSSRRTTVCLLPFLLLLLPLFTSTAHQTKNSPTTRLSVVMLVC